MKGFTPTGNGPKLGHSFSSKSGFSGSTGAVKAIGPYVRKAPKFAKGGSTGNACVQRNQPATEFDKEAGGKSPLRPGFKKGGLKKAMGGPVTMKKGGPGALAQSMAKKGGTGRGFNRSPLFGGQKG